MSTSSLFNNPQLIGNMVPGLNVSGMQQVLQAELQQTEAPLSTISSDLTTLTSKGSAWSKISGALQTLQSDAQGFVSGSSLQATGAATSSNPSAVAVSGSPTSQGSWAVNVSSLEKNAITNIASNQSSYTDTTALGWSGTLNFTVGTESFSVAVSPTDSMSSLAANITQSASSLQNAHLTATVLDGTSGPALSLSANASLSVTPSASFSPGISSDITSAQSYTPASFTVNGVSLTANSNVLNSVVPGATLTLAGVGSSTLLASQDVQKVAKGVSSLVGDVQNVVQQIRSATGKGGALQGNTTLNGLQNQLVSILDSVNSTLPQGQQSLADLGLSVTYDTTKQQQNISFDSSKLAAALQSSPNNMATLLSGVATQLQNLATGFTQTGGVIPQVQQNISQQESLNQSQQTALTAEINQQQTELKNQFAKQLQQTADALLKLQWVQSYVSNNMGSSSSGTNTSSSG